MKGHVSLANDDANQFLNLIIDLNGTDGNRHVIYNPTFTEIKIGLHNHNDMYCVRDLFPPLPACTYIGAPVE